ncbi:nucleotidyltransferase family protein [Streptomyces sp. WMMC940]|uniref:nucleotidyltransferase family protein n=1 Tax=Streptomyces sp. WMMC940 TaxID=3015153 RepID=UPI0022B6B0E7|nr:nucleotidyltransferase family protein [Streptomyces sp. WMMC940]MCZ7461807.1 nucleotidyltransferase family protein [Streptomyces sp. WMMC940]
MDQAPTGNRSDGRRLHVAGSGDAPPGGRAPGAAGPPSGRAASLPQDHTQAILETTKHVAALLKASGHPFALAGSVAAHAHGVPAGFQHDTDFCIRSEDVDGVVQALRDGGVEIVPAPEDWLVKARSGDEDIDLIFHLAGGPVTDAMLERAPVLAVDSVRMPVLAPYDLLSSLLAALSEHHCDFAPLLTVARTLRELIDWDALREEHQRNPLPDAFLYLLERLGVIEPREPREAGP